MPQKPRDSDAKQPLFSIAIPAYKDKTLLGLALTSILTQSIADLEVIVSDDSASDELQALVAATGDKRVVYLRRDAPAGAVANWNYCLDQCRGRYIVLMHHDERFAHPNCLAAIERTFRDTRAQVVVSALTIESKSGSRSQSLPHRAARRFTAAYFHDLALIYNTIGPVSVLALDQSAATVRFDERLRWLVDAEYYARLFAGRIVRVCTDSEVISHLEHAHRITDRLDTVQLETAERAAILSRESSMLRRAVLRTAWLLRDGSGRAKRILTRGRRVRPKTAPGHERPE